MTNPARRLLAGAIVLALVIATVTDTSPSIISAPDDRGVQIATLACADATQATSSGFVIDDDLVVTVAHAIFGSRDFAVYDPTGRWHEATLVHLDLGRDLALLRLPDLAAKPVTSARAVADDAVQMIAGAASGSVDGAIVRSVRIEIEAVGGGDTATRRGYELALAIEPGDSGAGVVNERGELVAIVFARSTTESRRTWAVAAGEVEAITEMAHLPNWECRKDADAELILAPPRRTRLAG